MTSLAELIDTLRRLHVLDAPQLDALAKQYAGQTVEPRQAIKKLVEQGLVSTFQANQIFKGKGNDLLLGSYVLVELLGEGGMGAVYQARNWKLGQTVALKLIRKERLTNAGAVKRFHREIRASAQLDHPNIVRAFDADEVGGTNFLVMEYVAGGKDLHKLVKEQGPLPVADACRAIQQAALGLQHAFERGLVHRDIKPHNLILSVVRSPSSVAKDRQATKDRYGLLTTDHGQVKILDFGLARLDDNEESSTLTQEGSVMGTMDYLAPEQARDSHFADIRADIYSLGCTLYYLIVGKAPFPGGTAAEKMYKHQFEEPRPIDGVRPDVPAALVNIVRKMMMKRPTDRYQAPAEVAVDLQAFLEGRPVSAGNLAPAPVQAATSQSQTFVETVNPFAGLSHSDTKADTPPTVKPPVVKAAAQLAGSGPFANRKLIFAIGGSALALVLIVTLVVTLSRGRTPPKEQVGPVFDLRPRTIEKTPAERLAAEEKAKEADAKKQRELEEQYQKTRMAAADADFPALKAKLDDKEVTFSSFAKEVAVFKGKHGGTPAAIRAAEMLTKLPSPLDALDSAKIPDDAKAAWKVSGFDGKDVVAVLGEHRRRHWAAVAAIAFNADGEIVSLGNDRILRRWNPKTGTEQLTKVASVPSPSWTPARFSADARLVAMTGNDHDRRIRLVDVATGNERPPLEGIDGPAWVNFAFSGDGTTLVGVDYGHGPPGKYQTALVSWDLATGKQKKGTVTPIGWAGGHSTAITRNGQTVFLSQCLSRTEKDLIYGVKRIDLATGKEQVLLRTAECTLALSPDERWLAMSSGPSITIWDVAQNKESITFADGSGAGAFSPDSKLLAMGNGKVVEIATGKVRPNLPSGVFSHDGKEIANVVDGSVRLWDVATGKEVQPLTGHAGGVGAVAFSPDCKTLASAGGREHSVRLWDPATGKELHTLKGHSGVMRCVAFSPDGKTLASGSDDRTVMLWDPATGSRLRTLTPHSGQIMSIAFGPENKTLVAAIHDDGTVKVWDTVAGAEIRTLTGHMASLHSMALSPDGRIVAIQYIDGAVKLRDSAASQEPRTLKGNGHNRNSNRMAFSPDGKTLAMGSTDGAVKLWDLDLDNEPRTLKGHTDWACAVSFSHDGKTLASAGSDGRVILWKPETGAKLHAWQLPGGMGDVAFAADGRHLATANGNGTVYILRLPDELLPPKALTAAQAKRQQDDEAKRLAVPVQIENSIGMKLNLIPAGRFLMGPAPENEVTIAQPFCIGMTEVTVGQFRAYVEESGQKTQAERSGGARALRRVDPKDSKLSWENPGWQVSENHPVACVSWNDALAFCAWLSKREGRTYRLPTEAEWEYSCRAGASTTFSHGKDGDSLGQIAWYDKNSANTAHPVAQLKPNTWGLFDMHGNVYEWCSDRYDEANHSMRGGSFYVPPNQCRADLRDFSAPDDSFGSVGFRVVCDYRPPQITNSIGMKLARIPAGKFLMGSPENEPGRQPNEGPQHEVTITKPFHIGVYEVTQGEYEKVTGTNPSKFTKENGGGPDHPVETVSWDDAVAFCKKLSDLSDEKKAGRVYRLPTEAEWEYACRAGTRTAYSFGDETAKLDANAWVANVSMAQGVGKKPSNPWGLHDMIGNLWEWCADPYVADYYRDSPRMDPIGPAAGATRVCRGSGFSEDAKTARAAFRYGGNPAEFRNHNLGFRVVCEIGPAAGK